MGNLMLLLVVNYSFLGVMEIQVEWKIKIYQNERNIAQEWHRLGP